MNNSKK